MNRVDDFFACLHDPAIVFVADDESANITRIFESLARSCFEACTLVPTKWDNTPLTLVYLMKELSSKLKGGVKPLLKMVEDILPKKYTVSGEQFSPLSLEWKALTMFYFTEELHTNYDDALVTVRVPVEIEWVCLPPGLTPPAGFVIVYRAVVIEGMQNVPPLDKGVSTVPWSTLTLVDYKTGVMRCILPKSEAATFGSNTFIWSFTFDGKKIPLRPIGPPKRQDTSSPPIYTRSLRDSVQSQQGGRLINNPTIDMTVKETELSYRITLRAVQPETTLQSFNIQGDQSSPRKVKIKCKTSKGKEKQTSELEIELPCVVVPPRSKTFTQTNMLDLKKAQESIQGSTMLPLRRIDVSTQPVFPSSRKKDLIDILCSMFTSDADRLCKMLQSSSKETIFKVKETIQTLLTWSIDPPKEIPRVRAYRFLRGDHQRPKNYLFGYFPHDIFISVRKLHIVNGLPTLDIVWMDFEIYRKQVPYGCGIDSQEAEMFLLENGGSILTPGTCTHHYLSLEESVLLKKLLRLNTQRSVQKLKVYGSPTWCFSSFLQPVYAVLAEYDLLKQGAMARAPDVSDGSPTLMSERQTVEAPASSQISSSTGLWSSCTCCGNKKPDMKRCSRCKSVFYCSDECQTKDWENIHKQICRTLQALHDTNQPKYQDNPRIDKRGGRCGYSDCGVFSDDLKACARCRNIAYCRKQCQQKDWINHKAACAAQGKTKANK